MAENYMELYQKALAGLKTGGKTLEASLAEIEQGKKEAIAGGQQSLVSSGLSGTTMGAGVPIQAEKIASRQRLGARGRAEQTYLTTLASFAAFSQRGIEAQKQRDFETKQAGLGRRFTGRQAELDRIASAGTTQYGKKQRPSLSQFMSEFDVRNRGGGEPNGGGGYAEQFPAIYDQGGTAPDLMGGTADTPWPTPAPLFGEQEELEVGGGYTPQTGDYMSVGGGPGGGILGGGSTTSYGGATQTSGWTQIGQKTGPRGKSITVWRAPDGSTRNARSGQKPGVDFN